MARTLRQVWFVTGALGCLLLILAVAPVQAATLKLVQSGTLSSSSATTHVVNITAVDTSKSFLIFQTRHNSNRPGGSAAAGRVASATTLEFLTTRSDPIDIQWYLVEFSSGVKVQRGEVYQDSAIVDIPISQLAALDQAFVTWSKAINGSHSTWGTDDPVFMQLTATNNLQLRSSASTSNHRIWWQVIEYTNAADIQVQRGTTSIASNRDDQSVAISPVDLTKSILLAGNRIAGDANQINRHTLSAEFSDSATLLFSRHREGGNVAIPEIGWQVVEFLDGTLVQSGVTKVSKNSLTKAETLSPVNPDRTIALGSAQPAGGQNMGNTKYKNDDIPGVTAFTLGLTASTLTLQRNSDLHEATLGWFVVEFPAPKLAEWRMDETSWGTVQDATGNGYDGTALNGAVTAGSDPAIPGSPGTCRYGTFDGNNDYIDLAGLPNLTESFTITAWIKADEVGKDQRIFADDQSNSGGFALSLGDGGDGKLRFFSRQVNPISVDTQSAVISAGTWHHVAAVHDVKAKTRTIYVDGVAVMLNTGSTSSVYTGTWGSDPGAASLAGENSAAGGEAVANWRFNGSLDEVRVYTAALSQSQIQVIKDETRPCAASSALLVGEWRLDEPRWDGTPGEVLDSSGQGNHGTAVADAGIQDPGKLCRAGAFDGAGDHIRINNLSNYLNDSASLAFWIKTTQTGHNTAWQAPGISGVEQNGGTDDIFWGWLDASGHIGISVGNDSSTKSTTAINNGAWRHVVLTRDASLGAYKIYIDGVLNQSGAIATGIIGNGYTSIGRIENTAGSSTYFNGQLDEVMVFDGVLSDAEVLVGHANQSAGKNWDGSERSCPSTDAFGFNCVEGGADALSGRLNTKLVGQPFTIEVAALKDGDNDGTADAVEADFAKDADRTVTVELIDTSGSAVCSAYPALSPAVEQSLLFSSADAGRKAAAAFTVNHAYRSLGCRVTDSTGATPRVGCSTDQFAVRPQTLVLTAPLLNNGGSSGDPKAVAGSNFTLEVGSDSGYDGTPLIDSGKLEPHAGAVATGILVGSFSAASPVTGTASGDTFSYSEVGNFHLLAQGVYDNSFTAVDQPGDCTDDFSNTSVGGKVGCKFGNLATSDWVGRFIPADFTFTITDQGALLNSCVGGGFSYAGTPIGYAAAQSPAATITARNSSGITTQNYTGVFNKLPLSGINIPNITSDGTQLGADGITRVGLTWSVGLPALIDNGDGTLGFRLSGDSFTYGRTSNDRVAPFTSDVQLMVQGITDDDGVNATGLPQRFTPTGVELRYGRMAMQNAQGSELLPLRVPLQVEYYAGAASGFVVNGADTCTAGVTLTLSEPVGQVVIAGGSRNTAIYASATDAGAYSASDLSDLSLLLVQPPLAGDFNLNLQAPGQGNTGSARVEVDAPSWLEYTWSGTAMEDPSAKATFGVFSRPGGLIYQRETY
ncbi:DUF6701 domain-containing protein [Sedimenticola sp.]|uniref:DUF6701 domain-containing protein n=1 Tax=Sedimenticola sp. TaxID=1940285 RepID=UPI003D144EB8